MTDTVQVENALCPFCGKVAKAIRSIYGHKMCCPDGRTYHPETRWHSKKAHMVESYSTRAIAPAKQVLETDEPNSLEWYKERLEAAGYVVSKKPPELTTEQKLKMPPRKEFVAADTGKEDV